MHSGSNRIGTRKGDADDLARLVFCFCSEYPKPILQDEQYVKVCDLDHGTKDLELEFCFASPCALSDPDHSHAAPCAGRSREPEPFGSKPRT